MSVNSFGTSQYHIACKKGDLAKFLLVPGDPERIPKITKFWNTVKEISVHREFRSATGTYKGTRVSALASGIGPACMAIAVNEASAVGVRNFVRIGSTAAIQKNVECGDLVFSTAAVRLDCTSNSYVIPEFPAVANYEVLIALIEAAETLGINNYHLGITATTADFYAGQDRKTLTPSTASSKGLLSALQNARVLNFEMETATLYVLASLFGLRAGSVCAVYGNRCTNKFVTGAGEENAIKVGNEAVKILSEWDKLKTKKQKPWVFPSLAKHLQKNSGCLKKNII
jgi:uridine phosphorylase